MGLFHSTTSLFLFLGIRLSKTKKKKKKMEMHRMAERHWTLNGESTLYILILVCVPLRLASFKIQGWRKSESSQKCTEWPQDGLERLTVKRALYTKYLHMKPKFRSVSIYGQSHFRDTRLSKIKTFTLNIQRRTSEWLWTLNSQKAWKAPCIHYVITREAPNVWFISHLRLAIFKIWHILEIPIETQS